MTTTTPRAFGFLRSRSSCAILALLLRQQHDVKVSRETVRCFLHRGHLVYGRPRPRRRSRQLRMLLEGLSTDETSAWQDEVEVHTNPRIGQM